MAVVVGAGSGQWAVGAEGWESNMVMVRGGGAEF